MAKKINKNKEFPEQSVSRVIERRDDSSMKNTLRTYDNAVRSAESIDYPNRTTLIEHYTDAINGDGHLSSVLEQRKNRILGLNFVVNKNTGKQDTQATELLQQEWFFQFINHTMDALFFGNSLVEIQNIDDQLTANLVSRKNVIPEFKMIKINEWSTDGDIDYSSERYKNSLIDINNENNQRSLGRLQVASRLSLMKKEAAMSWGQLGETYGFPFRIATTDSTDGVELKQIEKMLTTLGKNGWGIKNSQTIIDFITPSGGVNPEVFSSFIKYLNEEISKYILGGTMLTDSGSSRSQAEVHERGSYLITKSDIRFVTNVINNKLIPLLVRLGVLTNSTVRTFKFVEPELMTNDDKIKTDEFLLKYYDIDKSYFESRYNVKLNDKTVSNEKTEQAV